MSKPQVLKKWRKLSSVVERENAWWKYKYDVIELPSRERGEYHYVETNGSVMIVPVDGSGELILVRQYRYLNRRESFEFPGGGVKKGQDVSRAAHAELAEEAGLTADLLKPIGSFNPFNGVTSELCTVFIAYGLHACPQKPDSTEEFFVHPISRTNFEKYIKTGEVWDGMTLAAWSIFLQLDQQ